jgi:hypothetical protein
LGDGRLSLRGQRQRPWLELRRPETERLYLGHQLRQLRLAADGPLEVVRDVLPGTGFYDIHRVRLHGEGLYHAYGLLYPRDRRQLSPEVLAIAGRPGLAALLVDAGHRQGRHLRITGRYSADEVTDLVTWLRGLGYPARPLGQPKGVRLEAAGLPSLRRDIGPLVYPGQRAKIWRTDR